MSTQETPEEKKGVIYFIILVTVITFLYISIMTYLAPNPFEGSAMFKTFVRVLYVLTLFFALHSTNRNNLVIECRKHTKTPDITIWFSLLPFLIVFVPVYLLINYVFESWKAPFANTFGFMIINALGYKSIFQKKATAANFSVGSGSGSDDTASLVNNHIYGIMANKVNLFNLEKWLTSLKIEEKTDGKPNPEYMKFVRLINLKYHVSELLWLVLAGMVSSTFMMVSSNDVANCV